MRFFEVLLLVEAVTGNRLRGDCTSGGGVGCIYPISLDLPSKLNPATIITSQDQNGFVSAKAVPGDMPDAGPDSGFDDESQNDIALRFTISSPSLQPPPSPPPLITCDYDKCTTSTTTTPYR